MKINETHPTEKGFVLWGHCQNILDDPRKMFIHLSVSSKSSSMQLWFYVQTRHSLRPPLAKITLRVHPDSFTIAARTVPKDFLGTTHVRRLICKCVTIAIFAKKKRDVVDNAR